MAFGFLFWLFFVGIIVASLQDLKRREVDNWLNLFLIFSGAAYLLFGHYIPGDPLYALLFISLVGLTSFFYFYNGDLFSGIECCKKTYYCWLSVICLLAGGIIFSFVKIFGINEMPFFIIAASAFLIMYVVSNLFYEGRVFAGGDAKLLFAMTVFFIGATFVATLANIGIFLLFLMLAGSVYGLIYSIVLYVQDFKKVNKKIGEGFSILWVRYSIILGIILFALSYVSWWFLFLSIFVIVFPLLYIFAKGLENVSMTRNISGKELREGDWLVEDIKVGRKTIKADWDGLSLGDIALLRKKKKVKIKEGLPFVPAFLIAFVLYVFLREWFVDLLIGLA